MQTLLYVSGEETSSRKTLSDLRASGYDEVWATTVREAEWLLLEGRFRTVIIGPGLFHRERAALAALATTNSLWVILVCTDPSDYAIDADLYVDQTEGEPGILRAVAKASTVESYEVTV